MIAAEYPSLDPIAVEDPSHDADRGSTSLSWVWRRSRLNIHLLDAEDGRLGSKSGCGLMQGWNKVAQPGKKEIIVHPLLNDHIFTSTVPSGIW
jgi:hypothetical protein